MTPPSTSTRPLTPPVRRLSVLAELLAESGGVERLGSADPIITGISLATQRIRRGDLYAALPGTRTHGAAHAAAALEAGALAVLTDPVGAALLPEGTDAIVVPQVRAVLGSLAAYLYGFPATRLTMLAVTGTQGKTTTTRLLDGALERAGVPAAVIGTVGTRVLGEEVATSLTTPEAPDLQALFARMIERGVRTCAMEVSSHALVLGRVDGIRFDVATFLNLGRDHLDFHTDLEDYYRAKARLFTPERTRRALINIDDEHGRRLRDETVALGVPVRTFALDRPADWRGVNIVSDAGGSSFTLIGPEVQVSARVPLAGRFNVANAVAALATAGEAGLELPPIAGQLGTGGGVPGRLESVDVGQDFSVVVDYAHKPDAVEAALSTLRPLTRGRLIVVLGAGGDRDPGKRPLMGAAAARLADVLVVTDDNPRTEDPAAVRAEVLAGARGAASGQTMVLEQGDRRQAIRDAVRMAAPGDIVLVAGKGHETGQESHGVVHPFDDRTVAAEEVAAR